MCNRHNWGSQSPHLSPFGHQVAWLSVCVCAAVTEMLVNVLSICSDDELMNDGEEIYDGKKI